MTQTLRHLITETNYNTLTKGDIKEALKATGVAHPFTSDEWGPIAVAVGKEVAARVAAAEADGGGGGNEKETAGDGNEKAIIDLLTEEGKVLAEVQRFMPEVKQGDKRVLLLDGEPLGAILRVPPEGDHRANIHIGGSVLATELDSTERKIVEAVGPRLREDGLYFVGLDLIGGKLTEVNVTSPTGIRELSDHRGERMSDRVIRWVEKRAG